MPPILLMKRMLDEFDESSEQDEVIEPRPKRQRDDSPSEHQDEEEDDNEEQNGEGSKDKQRGGDEKSMADSIVEIMMPRVEAQIQQIVNGAAMRMLDVLGQKLSRLETRMEEM